MQEEIGIIDIQQLGERRTISGLDESGLLLARDQLCSRANDLEKVIQKAQADLQRPGNLMQRITDRTVTKKDLEDPVVKRLCDALRDVELVQGEISMINRALGARKSKTPA